GEDGIRGWSVTGVQTCALPICRGLKVDHRSDLFSLGVVLYRLVTGKMPFTGTSTMAVLTSLAVDTPTSPRQLNAQLPESVEALRSEKRRGGKGAWGAVGAGT